MKRILTHETACFVSYKNKGNNEIHHCSKPEWELYLLEVKLSEEFNVPDSLIKEFVEKARELESWEERMAHRDD